MTFFGTRRTFLTARAAALGGIGGNDSYTKLLLHVDADFTDSSASGHSPTLVNTPTISTTTKKFGAGSGSFASASSQGVTFPDHADWNVGSGDFTIDAWIYLNSTGANQAIVHHGDQATNSNSNLMLRVNNANQLTGNVWYGGSASGDFSTTGTISASTWTHVAMVRNGSTITLYIDGTGSGTFNISTNTMNDSSEVLRVGFVAVNGYYMNGFIDELRFSKGIARWTSNFTPPSEAYS